MTALLLSPHNDDAALFAAFTCYAEKPEVITVLRSVVQEKRGTGITAEQRRLEDAAAMEILGCVHHQWSFPDDAPEWETIADHLGAMGRGASRSDGELTRVYAPLAEPEGGHPHHDKIGLMSPSIFGAELVTYYATYTTNGKSETGERVEPAPGAVSAKLAALACYRSQSDLANCRPHFLRGLDEYLVAS